MKKTILLADDSATIQKLVLQIFGEDDGFKVVAVSNGDAAVRQFDQVQPHIVIADVFMPGKNGYEVCAFVKDHPVLQHTPVVLLVGAFESFDAAESERVRADGQITKPFEPQALFDLVTGEVAESGPEQLDEDDDILGLDHLFPKLDLAPPDRAALTSEEVDLIADRVISRLSSEVIEGIAWDVVPEIAEKIVREEFKKHDEH